MMLRRSDELLIEDYLENRLPSDMKLEVEFRLQSDVEFYSELILRKEIQESIAASSERETLREKILRLSE